MSEWSSPTSACGVTDTSSLLRSLRERKAATGEARTMVVSDGCFVNLQEAYDVMAADSLMWGLEGLCSLSMR